MDKREFTESGAPPSESEGLQEEAHQILDRLQDVAAGLRRHKSDLAAFDQLILGSLVLVSARDQASSSDRLKDQKDPDLESFKEAEPLEKIMLVISRLPQKAALEVGKDSLSFWTDFAKLAESIPGVKLEGPAKDVAQALRSVDVVENKFVAKLASEVNVPFEHRIPLLGKTKEFVLGDKDAQIKFDLSVEKEKGDSISLSNICGLAIKMEGDRSLAIHKLTLESKKGVPVLSVTLDNPAKRPASIPERLWPRTVTVPVPLDIVAPGLSEDFLKGVIRTLNDVQSVLNKKDFSQLLQHIPEQGLRNTADALLKGVSSIYKNGDQISIRRKNGDVKHDLGGPDLTIKPDVSFRVGKDAAAPRVFDVHGIQFSVPLPEEFKAGARLRTNITGVDLGPRDEAGNRAVTVSTGVLLDKVSTRIDKQMQPVKDREGNWYVNVRMRNLLSENVNDKLDATLRLGKNGGINMKPSEILDIVSRASGQASDFSFKGAGLAAFSIETKVASGLAYYLGW